MFGICDGVVRPLVAGWTPAGSVRWWISICDGDLSSGKLAAEALANVAKHAGASRARVELSITDHDLLLRVSDDGNGGADPQGSGLRGLCDRASAVDGHLTVHSPPGAGTLITARLPLTPGALQRV